MAMEVIKEDAPMFTRLFPMSMALRSLEGSLSNLLILLAPFSLFSTICFRRILLRDIRAVSEAENKPEKIKHKTRITNFQILPPSKENHHLT
jgi:hypothetical protein